MACNFYTIRIVAGNSFTLVLPLKMRTYVATVPFDEDIDIMALVGCKVTIGGVEYACTLDPSGVQVAVPDGLAQGTYDIILTAEYHGAQIRAAYFEALQSVAYNKDSDAVQYIAGSPIVAQAAYVIGGALTDAELEALKAEYRQKIADAEAAEAAAEAAKDEYDRKAEQLDDVAQQTTLTQGISDIRGDISHIDIDTTTLAKEATAQAAKDAALALAPVAQAAEAYNTGKVQLATNITAKGVQASPSDTLPQLASKVAQIAQQPIVWDESEVGDQYAAQLFGGADNATSPLWNLYEVLKNCKNTFLNAAYEHEGNIYNYNAFIVCEYCKGYDSLELKGADAYFTCDGDFYNYANPTHVWHDSENGKANRWVCFLYVQAGSSFEIRNTAISPRSMYIGGHIGAIEYFVNGRLTDLVSGVEETDVVDEFYAGGDDQWKSNIIIRGVNNIYKRTGNNSIFQGEYSKNALTIYLQIKELSDSVFYNNKACTSVILPYLENITGDIIFDSAHGLSLISVQMPSLKVANPSMRMLWGAAPDLIDITVGEMITNLRLMGYLSWNPTNVLADATKKAQLIDNIKNHILARVSDATGGTQLVFTISTNMYNAIASETITWNDQTVTLADAFLTKNWLLAGA